MTTLHTVAATGALKLSWLLLAFPLFGAAVLLLGGRRTNRWGHLLGVAMPVAAFVYGMIAFLAAMLLLVLGDNYLVLYVGWEGVGLASYLLIGFWQYKPSAAVAAKKAFIVNRVGDAGLTLAIFLMFTEFGTVSFTGVFGTVGSAGSGVATALGLLLLLGACGKSAQVPLQSWLLDAMEGPTPVSALIHAATMVTAG